MIGYFNSVHFFLAATILFLMASCYPSHADAAVNVTDPNLEIKTVTQGLKFPAGMVFLNPNEILVLEKDSGKVQRVVNGKVTGNPEFTFNINNLSERGLLGIAIQKENDDKDSDPKYLYLFYTEPRYGNDSSLGRNVNTSINCNKQECNENQFNNRLYRYEYKDNKWINPKLLMDIPIYWNNRVYPEVYSAIINGGYHFGNYPVREGIHQGGKLLLDNDNNIFLVTGDGGGCLSYDSCIKSIENGFLSVKTANKVGGVNPIGMGGILHITKDGYPVSDGGIIGDAGQLDYYYAYGIRNSFGLDIDPISGKLWDTENGPHFGDEINLVEPGFNSGWAKMQGIWPIINYTHLQFNASEKGYPLSSIAPFNQKLENFDGKGHYSDPELTWNKSMGITSIKFLDTDRLGKQYENDMFVADAYGTIYHFDLNEDRTALKLSGPLTDKVANNESELHDFIFAQGLDTITDMKVGPDGYLYVLSYSGKIFKVSEKIGNKTK
jgi:glucose/arabinose dehydrogenase